MIPIAAATLEDALALQRNRGQSLAAIHLATAIERSPGSSGFRQIGAASNAYGLTTGRYRTGFSMRDTGQAITQPMGPDEGANALVKAALTPALFRQIYDYYKNKKFPERQFLEATLVRQFNGTEAGEEVRRLV